MAEKYGVTPQGFVPKRLDVILEELHGGLSADLGIDTRQNEKSYLNVLLTNFSDKIAELWEIAEESYQAKYPSSAQGVSLDHAAQFGGSVREDDQRTFYPIDCTGDDKTELPAGTRIASDTTPAVNLSVLVPGMISLSNCNRFVARLAGNPINIDEYTVSINSIVFRPPVGTAQTEPAILQALAEAINAGDVGATAEAVGGKLFVESGGHENRLSVVLSSTMTTTEVCSTVEFATDSFGKIELPNGTVTKIVSAPAGLKSIINQSAFIAGRKRMEDDELRVSYAERIFLRSRTMLESVESAVLGIQGVRSCKAYQNEWHLYNGHMPPHSVETVVDGDFDNAAVAKMILSSKAGGIRSCHCCGLFTQEYAEPSFGLESNAPYLQYAEFAKAIEVPDENGELITVRFTKPISYVCDISVGVTLSPEPLAVNAFDLITKTVRTEFEKLKPGSSVKPQEWHSMLYKNVSGIAYFDITINVPGQENAKFITGLRYNYRPVCGSVNVFELEV
jgi:uncharacterized phage protein gp47/JayE